MDLAVGNQVVVHHVYPTRIIDPYEQSRIDSLFQKPSTFSEFRFDPGVSALFATADDIEIPIMALGMVQLVTPWMELGIIAPPTIVPPGSRGVLTLSLYNGSGSMVLIRPGDVIWSLHLAQASAAVAGRSPAPHGPVVPEALTRPG